jgi:ATP-dependent exoDNAse (exonuclease V) beta subunit
MSASPVTIADAGERAAALDPRRSFIVQAPAGSGKTELLVRRYLQLLRTVEHPEEILAITFTRKAAAEMKQRILNALAGTPVPGMAAADISSRIRVQTIDALCASLTRQMPVLAKFGAQPETAEKPDALYVEAARRALALEPRNAAAENLLAHLDNDVAAVVGLLAGMLGRRDQWLRKTGQAPARAELEAAFAAERARLTAIAREVLPDASGELAVELLTQKATWRKKQPRAQALEAADHDGSMRAALATLMTLPPAQYSEAQWAVLSAMLTLLPRAAAELKLVFAERGQADFTEIAQGAVRALGEPEAPTDLLLSLDVRIKHILIDEFQDTSISQRELLERLIAGWQDGDGRTLFAVGDPMQSIYRFREAEVGLFLNARHEGIGGIKLEFLRLKTNFRSQAGIVDWVNTTFPAVLPPREDAAAGAVPYAAAVAHHPAAAGDAVDWHLPDAREDEAACLVEVVQAARAADATGSIAILVRNRGHLDHVVPALQDAGIRFRAVEIEHLGEKQVVQDLFALTRALTHVADRVAWLTLLRAPWCGLTPVDLSLLAEGADDTVWELMQDASRIAGLGADARARIARMVVVLEPALANRLRCNLRDAVEGVWLALGGPACCRDATALEDAAMFLDELERVEEAGDIADPAAFAESLEKLYALPNLAAGDDAVQIMTVHKSKGLEFDTVIVPGLDRAPRHNTPPLILWKALPDAGLLLAPIHEAGGGKDPCYEYVRGLERAAEDLEAGRLLYVAATRAKSRLHLLGCIKRDDHGAAKPPNKRSLLRALWLFAEEHVRAAVPAAVPPAAPAPRAAMLSRFAPGYVLPAPPPAAAWRAPAVTQQQTDIIEFSWAGETARHLGSVVHRWMQRIADDGIDGWTVQRVAALQPRLARELERRGVPRDECKEAAARAARALTQTLDDARGRWLLGAHAEAASEYRMRVAVNGTVYSCVMDRVFRDDAGTRWIVDYKTSGHEGGNVDAFLDSERERYAAQLARYALALGESDKTMLGLYFPLLSGWREWKGSKK